MYVRSLISSSCIQPHTTYSNWFMALKRMGKWKHPKPITKSFVTRSIGFIGFLLRPPFIWIRAIRAAAKTLWIHWTNKYKRRERAKRESCSDVEKSSNILTWKSFSFYFYSNWNISFIKVQNRQRNFVKITFFYRLRNFHFIFIFV